MPYSSKQYRWATSWGMMFQAIYQGLHCKKDLLFRQLYFSPVQIATVDMILWDDTRIVP